MTKVEEDLDTNAKNWVDWCHSMFLVLDIVNARGYVEGKIERPDPGTDPIGAENWRFNDSYTKMLIAQNIAALERLYTRECKTAHDMWMNLRKIHLPMRNPALTAKLRILYKIRAEDGDDIVQHLVKLKRQWDQIAFYDRCEFNDELFKLHVAVSLPPSWDNFTRPYLKRHVDDDTTTADPKKGVDSRQLIGLVIQEYQRIESRKEEEIAQTSEGEKTNSSLANRTPRTKRRCEHCGKWGHYTSQCRYIGQNKCHECGRFGHESDNCNQSTDERRPENSYPNKRPRRESQEAIDV
jgi:hypothetical protein